MKKTILTVLLIAAILCTAAGCGGEKTKNETDPTAAVSAAPSTEQAGEPTAVPTEAPTAEPTEVPTPKPTKEPVATIEPGKETYAEGIASDDPVTYTFASTAQDNRHYMVQDSIAIQFFATVSFTEIDISCPSYSDDKGTLEFALFRWMGTYESTVYDSEPIYSASFVDYKDNELLKFVLDTELSDGEYLLYITTPDPSLQVGIWAKQPVEGDTAETRFYASDVEFPEVMAIPTIHYTKTPNKLAGPLMDSGIEE